MDWLQAFFPNDQHPDHHKPLDGLRGLAVLLVVFGHGNNHGLGPFGDHSLLIRGKLGVYLFFVLSAYLLDRQIIKMFQQERAGWDYWLYYISRRILRIFPLFFLALVVFRLANASGLKVVVHEWEEVWQHLALQRGDHIFWSIPVEFKYYLISPILLFIFHRLFRWNAYAIVISLLTIMVGSHLFVLWWNPAGTSTLWFLNIFLLGTLVALIERLQPKLWSTLTQSRFTIYFGWAALLVLSLWSWKAENYTNIGTFIPAASLWSIALVASFKTGLWANILSWKPLRWVGAVSFSMYLFHIPVLMWVKSFALPSEIAWLSYLALTAGVTAITYLFVERPLQNFKPFVHGSAGTKPTS
jgi:peptidoglycan/LPS O-acetylase OafA/YrhL